MKATGIVRRIDELGRIVIPKEIRRTLRIRESDPLEIYTDNAGKIIFKKYSAIAELSSVAEEYASIISKNSGFPILISDKEQVVAVAGVPKKEFLGRRISTSCENLIQERKNFSICKNTTSKVLPVEGIDYEAAFIFVINSQGDALGSLIALKNGTTMSATKEVENTIKTGSELLGKSFED